MKQQLFFIFSIVMVLSTTLSGCTVYAPEQTTVPTDTHADEKSATTFDLSNQGLTAVPAYVFSKTNTEELDVSHNALSGAVQAEIRQLQKLQVLNLSHNTMTGLPAEIGQLQQLRVLDVSHNQLTGLPYELGNLQNLEVFDISGNNYSEYDLGIIAERLPVDCEIIQ